MLPSDADPARAHAEEHLRLAHSLSEREAQRAHALRNAMVQLRTLATRLRTRAVLCGRIKSAASIAEKMSRGDREEREILDILGVRIIVSSVTDCYRLWEQVRVEFDVLEEEFDDYISEPKLNGYQSLHATVVQDGLPVEIQIRTRLMHVISECGSAQRSSKRGA